MLALALFAAATPAAEIPVVGAGDTVPLFVLQQLNGAEDQFFILRQHIAPHAQRPWRAGALIFVASWSDATGLVLAAAKTATTTHSGVVLLDLDSEAPGQNLLRAQVEQARFQHPVVMDPHRVLSRRFGVNALPTIVTFDEAGKVLRVMKGATQENLQVLLDTLEGKDETSFP